MSQAATKVTNCDGCGACCMGQNLVPYSDISLARLACKRPPRAIPLVLLEDLEAIMCGPLFGDDNCPCIWLNRASGKCNHHQHRPNVCRDFEIGGEACLEIRRRAGIK